MNELKKSINACYDLLSGLKIDYNSQVGPKTSSLIQQSKALAQLASPKYPQIANILNEAIGKINNRGLINAYAFGDLRTSIKILRALEFKGGKKIFISHSSRDKKLVSLFVDHILRLGIGLRAEDIFCSSIEEMGIKNGADIRSHIQENIRNAEFSFLLISKNYKKSEICLNEMGAVWAYDSNVRLYLLPGIKFTDIGWLCDVREAEYINDDIALDALRQELVEYYSLNDDVVSWGRQRKAFINGVTL